MSNVKGQNFEFSNGYNYLMLKAEEGNLEEVRKTLTDSQVNINAVNRNGSTALSLSAKNGHYKIVETLIRAGADVNIKNNSGQSPLFLACWNNYKEIVRLVLDNSAEINTKDQRGWTPLMIAAYNGHQEVVKLLMERKADINIRDCFDKTALDRTKDPKIAEMLGGSRRSQKSHEGTNAKKTSFSASPERSGAKDQPQSILRKSSPKIDGEYSNYEDMEKIKIHDFQNQQNYTTASTVYPSLRYQDLSSPQMQVTNDSRVLSSGKRESSSYYHDSRHANNNSISSLRKNSDPKASRYRTLRQKASIDKSICISSRSPAKSAIVASSRTGKHTPSRSREIMNVTSPLSEAKKQSLKEDLSRDVTDQVESVSGQIKDIVAQRIAIEVPQHMRKFEQDLGKELNSVFQFRMDNLFKSLNASFNLKAKFCLNKLGYDTGKIDLAPFSEQEAPFTMGQKPFNTQIPKYNFEKETRAIERDISRLEKSVSAKSFSVIDKSVHNDYGCGRNGTCDHSSFAFKTQIREELFEQLAGEVRSTTEYLMEYSNGKIGDIVRTETGSIYQKMFADLNRTMEVAEEEFKNKFESLINQKVNELVTSLGGAPQGQLASNKKASPDITPSKQLFSSLTKGSERKITFSQDLERAPKEEKPVHSDYGKSILRSPESLSSHKLGSSANKEKDFVQTRNKIEKLKNSLNFIDERLQPLVDRAEESYKDKDSQKEVRRELLYHQLEAGDSTSMQESLQSHHTRSILSEKPDFIETIKKEYNDSSQTASKLEEIRNFYQKKYGNPSMTSADNGPKKV